VFIHGLFGHPFNTWAVSGKATRSKGDSLESQRTNGNGNASNVFWPRDLLPGVIPNALIYSWGYDADVQNFMSTASLNTIHQHSSNLLNDLADLRDEFCQESHLNIERSCPFIFVVHSLGGLIVKDALNISASMDETRDRRRSQVVKSTIGAVFLGTPHRGSKTASLGKTAFRVTEIFASQRPNTKLLQALERNSETLERITNSFYETLSKHKDLKIYSFREEKEVRRLGVFGMLVVPPDSARIGHANEDVGSIPEDHRHMAKYISSQDTGFVRVSKAIKRCVNDFKERTTSMCSYELSFDGPYRRRI
jgi:hypothetical protein